MKENEKYACDVPTDNSNDQINKKLAEQLQKSDNINLLPEYQCIKHVKACKIKQIIPDGYGEDRETNGSAIIIPESSNLFEITVDHHYMTKHKPQVGGYYVVYKDGYESYSPADAFEDGYIPIN